MVLLHVGTVVHTFATHRTHGPENRTSGPENGSSGAVFCNIRPSGPCFGEFGPFDPCTCPSGPTLSTNFWRLQNSSKLTNSAESDSRGSDLHLASTEFVKVDKFWRKRFQAFWRFLASAESVKVDEFRRLWIQMLNRGEPTSYCRPQNSWKSTKSAESDLKRFWHRFGVCRICQSWRIQQIGNPSVKHGWH